MHVSGRPMQGRSREFHLGVQYEGGTQYIIIGFQGCKVNILTLRLINFFVIIINLWGKFWTRKPPPPNYGPGTMQFWVEISDTYCLILVPCKLVSQAPNKLVSQAPNNSLLPSKNAAFATILGTTFGKNGVDMSTPVHPVATPLFLA